MPKNSKNTGTRKNRRTSSPNVFVQSSVPDNDDDDTGVVSVDASSTSSRPTIKVERTNRRASVRSEIYTRSLSGELRKMGALSAGIVIVLVVLTFAL